MLVSRSFFRISAVFTLFLLAVSLSACSGEGGGTPGAGGPVSLQGAGATFPNPLYQKWMSEYGKLHPNAKIDYNSQGSGAGIQGIQKQTIDFGASDAPMSDADLKAAPGELLHIPTVLGAVVLTYNLPGLDKPLRFSPDTIADIFLGKIKKWDDAKIKADNPTAKLPNTDITVVHRSDGSGTTFVFTDYLSKVSPEWKSKVGTDKSPKWPDGVGMGQKGNEGVTGTIKNTPNTIGYVELNYAAANSLPVAQIKNKAGNFVYPISSYTYILVYKEQKDATKGKLLVDFLWWGLHDGQKYAKDLQYAPLPDAIVKRAEAKVNSITSGGKPLRG